MTELKSGRGPRDPKVDPTGERWTNILEAATAEFREFGYDGATIRGIAERVGLLKGSLYNYITGKEDLFRAVVEGPSVQLIEALRAMSETDEPAAEKLTRLIQMQISIFSNHFPAPFVYLARTKNRTDLRFDEWDREYVKALEELLQGGVSKGEFREDLDVVMTTRAIIGMLDWMLAWYEPRTPDDDKRIEDAFWLLITRGVLAD